MSMSRRENLKALCGLGAVSALVMPVMASPKKYGRVTVASHREHYNATGESLHVYLDGVEVTKVYEADDVQGYVQCFCRDLRSHSDWQEGRDPVHLTHPGGKPCSRWLIGHVVIAPGEAFS